MARISTWWGKAWVRAVEEAAYDEADLRSARRLVRTGAVGAVGIEPGSIVASTVIGDEVWTPRIGLPVFSEGEAAVVREVLEARLGWSVELGTGHLSPRAHVALEEAGAELLPSGSDFDPSCSCESWVQPCAHALAVLVRAGELIDAEPALLLSLRGVGADADTDLEAAVDAATLAQDLLDD